MAIIISEYKHIKAKYVSKLFLEITRR